MKRVWFIIHAAFSWIFFGNMIHFSHHSFVWYLEILRVSPLFIWGLIYGGFENKDEQRIVRISPFIFLTLTLINSYIPFSPPMDRILLSWAIAYTLTVLGLFVRQKLYRKNNLAIDQGL